MPKHPEPPGTSNFGVRHGCLLVKYMQNARLGRINGLARGVNLVLARKKRVFILKTTLKDNANTSRTTQITDSWGSTRLFTRQIHAKRTFRAYNGLARGVNSVLA